MTMDPAHRVMSGQTLTRRELIGAGIFAFVWFVLDLVQWVHWLGGRLGWWA